MSETKADANVALQVELAVSKLDSLAILPTAATQILTNSSVGVAAAAKLAQIVAADPALSINILALARAKGKRLADCDFSVESLCEQMPEQSLREAVLKSEVLAGSQSQIPAQLARTGLTVYSIGVACCARRIAEVAVSGINPQLAYTAGLLHNVGLFALADVMPKSFVKIVEEAAWRKVGIKAIEQEHLGTDHTILGKRLAQKWVLPPAIIIGIWLSDSESTLISQALPQARVAQMVRLACLITSACGIGQGPDFGKPSSPDSLAAAFSISAEQLGDIRASLPAAVAEKAALLGLDTVEEPEKVADTLRTTATQLALNNSRLALDNQNLRSTASQYEFIAEFLSEIEVFASPAAIAGVFAALWQKTYQTGKVCLALVPESGSGVVEAVVVESQSHSEYLSAAAPADFQMIPAQMAGGFDIIKADENIADLLERLDADFELGCTRALPLLSSGGVIGILIFEFRYPMSEDKLREKFEPVASTAASILDIVMNSRDNQELAERVVSVLAATGAAAPSKRSVVDSMEALTELAAGAAHEMNNPLSVISGRAQFLLRTEIDPERKKTLLLMQKNTDELSGIIDDLMGFASPPAPRAGQARIAQIIEEASQLAARKTGVEKINIGVEIADENLAVFVDSAQVVSAVANILANAVESYEQPGGAIKVSANAESTEAVELQISDKGCGMDSETLQKATHPFFSAKPAGRKRGMGLAYAQRFIELNKGTLRIQSAPAEGTTVTISVPRTH